MIKVQDIIYDEAAKEVTISAFSDTKSEVIPDAEMVGLPTGYKIAMGSRVLTASGEMAFMKSDGTWNWA